MLYHTRSDQHADMQLFSSRSFCNIQFAKRAFQYTLLLTLAKVAFGKHHLQEPARHLAVRQNSDLPLVVTSYCTETIYPAILTQSGHGPARAGFRLDPGDSLPQNVSADWRGRVWGRTNCTFNEDGSLPMSGQGGAACSSGDCGAFVECQGAVSDMNTGSHPDPG